MKTYARISDGSVVEVVTLEDDVAPEDAFHPTIAAAMKPCPTAAQQGWVFSDGQFSAPPAQTLDELKAERIATLRAACEASILGGFVSEALGSVHTYPSDLKAQINLMGSVTDSLIPSLPEDWQTPFWVCDEAGSWKWEMHNAAQIQQAGRDGKANVVRNQTKLDDLTGAVSAAKTKKAVEAVAW